MAGLILVPQTAALGRVIDDLVLVAEAEHFRGSIGQGASFR